MPRDGTATRDRILDTAERLVIDNGFGATSLDTVIAAAETSKGAFFHHFPTKRALADALVERYVAADLAMLEDGLAAARSVGDDAAARALAFLDFYVGIADEIMAETTGCLYASVLVEMELVDAGTSAPITTAVEAWRDGYAALIRDALGPRSSSSGSGIDVDALSDHVWVTFEGAYLLARSTGDPDMLRRQLGLLRAMVAALLDRSGA